MSGKYYPTTGQPVNKLEAGLTFPALTNIVYNVDDVSDNDTQITGNFIYLLSDA
jgi:hypothetical protein|tara:strand:- start:11313 stop:11474 length:162 start_codon:yes stop_codon:yes gene_type:complete